MVVVVYFIMAGSLTAVEVIVIVSVIMEGSFTAVEVVHGIP